MTQSEDQRGPDTEIVIERRLAAPRETVWRAWTEAEHLEKWCRPEGFTTRVDSHDFREGGYWRYVMIGPDGIEYPSEGRFIEIEPPRRVVSSDQFGEEFAAPDGVTLPQGIIVSLNFEEAGEETDVTVRISHATVAERQNHEQMGVVTGWNSTLDQLVWYLKQLQAMS